MPCTCLGNCRIPLSVGHPVPESMQASSSWPSTSRTQSSGSQKWCDVWRLSFGNQLRQLPVWPTDSWSDQHRAWHASSTWEHEGDSWSLRLGSADTEHTSAPEGWGTGLQTRRWHIQLGSSHKREERYVETKKKHDSEVHREPARPNPPSPVG